MSNRVWIIVTFALVASGCAGSVEGPSGHKWILGLTRSSMEAPTNAAAVYRSSLAAPLEIAVVPYGIEAGLGLCRTAEAAIFSSASNDFKRVVHGWTFGSKTAPWTFGLVHEQFPREASRARFRVDTVSGLRFRAASSPYLIAGWSRTTSLDSAATNIALRVAYESSAESTRIEITEDMYEASQ